MQILQTFNQNEIELQTVYILKHYNKCNNFTNLAYLLDTDTDYHTLKL